MLHFVIVLVFVLSGCDFHLSGGVPPGDPTVETPTAVGSAFDPGSSWESPDAGVDAVPHDLPLDAPCQPAMDQCATTLTCRFVGEDQGRCRPVGPKMVGAACADDSSCGANMTCLLDGGAKRCFMLCRRQAALERCTPQQVCDSLWGSEWDTGICTPI